jgi:hypothetical protein
MRLSQSYDPGREFERLTRVTFLDHF